MMIAKETSKTRDLAYKLRPTIGLLVMLVGLIMVIGTYVAFATGFIHKTFTGGDTERWLWPVIWLELLAWPTFGIGFMLNAKWKEDMGFTKHKIILLLAFLIFYPAPMINLFGGGIVPPIFTLLMGILCSVSCIPREVDMIPVLAPITLLGFAVLFCFGHIFSCFVYKYTKNKYISWVLLAVMATIAFFSKYIWGDVGGGEHDGNIVKLIIDAF